jgi:hypothetical protein
MTEISSLLNKCVDTDFTTKKTYLCHKSWYQLSENAGEGDLVIMLDASPVKTSPSLKCVSASGDVFLAISHSDWQFDYLIAEDVEHITNINAFLLYTDDNEAEVERLLIRDKRELSSQLRSKLAGLMPEMKDRYIEDNYERYALNLLNAGAVRLVDHYIHDNAALYGFDRVPVLHQEAE